MALRAIHIWPMVALGGRLMWYSLSPAMPHRQVQLVHLSLYMFEREHGYVPYFEVRADLFMSAQHWYIHVYRYPIVSVVTYPANPVAEGHSGECNIAEEILCYQFNARTFM